MSGCSGELLSALVDGALSPAERDRVHAHLAGCTPCRAEVEQLRALKARLGRSSCGTPEPSGDLVARLLGLAVPGGEPVAATARAPLAAGPWRSGPVAAAVPRRPASPSSGSGPGRVRRAARRGAAVGGGLVALGVGAALLLGGPSGGQPSTPVDPGSDAFVVDFVSTTGGVPLADPAGAATLPTRP